MTRMFVLLVTLITFFLSRSTRQRLASDLVDKPGQVITGCLRFSPAKRAFIFIARRVQHSHFSAFNVRGFASNFTNSRSHTFDLPGASYWYQFARALTGTCEPTIYVR